jgi:mono/diheme cytochrome c family protein
VIRPNAVSSFGVLYAQNCSGCHGADGQGGLTVGIGRPIYLAVADDATIRRVIQSGRAGTAMPAFAREAGGMLTRAQIDILLRGIRTSWAKPEAFQHVNLPAYAASEPGDPARGKHVFAAFCSSCHGPDGQGSRAIADSSFLALVSDQHLRTVTITGMPTLGMPDWRSHGKPMSDADISDVVAWLAAQRTGLSTNFSSTKLNPPGGVE